MKSRVVLTPETLRTLSQISTLRAVGQILIEWVAIAVILGLVAAFPFWWTHLLAIVVIGTRQHALAIMMHEATHHRISKNRKVNDLVGNIFCAWPIFVSVEGYRANHLPHHQHLNTEHDPDFMRKQGSEEWVFPKTKWAVARLYLKDFFLLNTFDLLKRVALFASAGKKPSGSMATGTSTENPAVGVQWARLLFYTGLILSLSFLNIWGAFFVLWVLPVFSILKVLLRNRSIAEHFAIDRKFGLQGATRTVVSQPVERWFLSPNNIGFHIEHHLYPSVPFHNLPRLHQELMKIPAHASTAQVTRTYLGLFQEVGRYLGAR